MCLAIFSELLQVKPSAQKKIFSEKSWAGVFRDELPILLTNQQCEGTEWTQTADPN